MKQVILSLITGLLPVPEAAGEGFYRLLTGSYTGNIAATGIHAYTVDCVAGKAELLSSDGETVNPSYLSLSPDGRFLYAVSEHGAGSAVRAYAFDRAAGRLMPLNAVKTGGADPCYLSVTEKHVITADYSGGAISVFGRKTDGSLTDTLQVIHHTGKSVHPERQKTPHVHQTIFTPDGAFLAVNDLGTDRVTIYRYCPETADRSLTPVDSLTPKRGGGPRHLAFHPCPEQIIAAQRSPDFIPAYIACVLHELDGTVSTLAIDATGRLKLLHETSIVRRSDVQTGAADIRFSPDGRFLYASNRGTANDITCFAVESDGRLTLVQQITSAGVTPRNFALTPDGKYLFVANQQTDNIVVFARNAETGQLTSTGQEIRTKQPVCLLFF
ncbi:MAG: lactonase family protein [Tannerella sp.]|jgi:6-phosphogluconolactonase|nr:lactonase family protein [Tannerella sp.]